MPARLRLFFPALLAYAGNGNTEEAFKVSVLLLGLYENSSAKYRIPLIVNMNQIMQVLVRLSSMANVCLKILLPAIYCLMKLATTISVLATKLDLSKT